jgi:hypothetical protein
MVALTGLSNHILCSVKTQTARLTINERPIL